VAKFPGRRMLPAGDYVVNPVEPALLADGVARDKLYPLDLPRAYKSLAKIKPHITKWVSSSSAIPQALVDGEIDLGMAAAGRIAELKASGAPVDFVYDEGIINFSILAIPKGAKNYENALKLISYIERPEGMAEYARQFYYGAVNSKSLELLTVDQQKPLNSYPENFAKQVRMRPDWWAERDASGKTNLDKNAALWNTFIL
jgi:putative spermidine/putrescine transport system substrate-binding protein